MRFRFPVAALLVLTAHVACSSHSETPEQTTQAADTTSVMHLIGTAVVGPGKESFICQLVQMPVGDSYVVKLSHEYTPGSHHLLLLRTDYPSIPAGKDAPFACDEDNGGMRHVIGAVYGVQNTVGSMQLPGGVGLPVHSGEILMMQMHYLNAGTKDLEARVLLDVTTITDGDKIQQRAGMIGFYNPYIHAPARSRSQATMRCPIPSDITLLTAASHMHKRGTQFDAFIDPPSGPITKTPFYTSKDWQNADVLPAPVKISAGSKLRFGCTYDNTGGDKEYFEGESAENNEMCLFGGLYYPEMGLPSDFCQTGRDRLGSGKVSCVDTLSCLKACTENTCGDKCVVASCPGASAPLLDYQQCTKTSCAAECKTKGLACDACGEAKCKTDLDACRTVPCD